MKLAHPTWEEDPDFDLANHVLPHQLPPGSTLEDGLDAAMTQEKLDLQR